MPIMSMNYYLPFVAFLGRVIQLMWKASWPRLRTNLDGFQARLGPAHFPQNWGLGRSLAICGPTMADFLDGPMQCCGHPFSDLIMKRAWQFSNFH